MDSTSSIRGELQGGRAVVGLAQPARGNPFDGDFGRDFKHSFSDLWNTAGLRAVTDWPRCSMPRASETGPAQDSNGSPWMLTAPSTAREGPLRS